MGEEFDPYYRWLGIPPEQRPPDHYRLLGIRALETDAEIIRTAAEQRTAYLRTFQLSQQGPLAERLLNEVSAARVCLLHPARKAEYDERLREEAAPAGEGPEGAIAPCQPPPLPNHAAGPPPVPPPVQRRAPLAPIPQWLLRAVAVVALAGGVLLGMAVLRWSRGAGDGGPVAIESGDTEPPRGQPAESPPESTTPKTGADVAKPAEQPDLPKPKPGDVPAEKPERPVEKPGPASDPPAEVEPAKSDPAKVEPVDKPQPKPAPRKPRPDPRIAQFREIYEAVVPLYREWEKLEKDAAPRRADLQSAVVECRDLEQRGLQLQRHLQMLQGAYRAAANDPDQADNAANLATQLTGGQQQLTAISASLLRARNNRAALGSEVRQLNDKQAQLTATADRHTRSWVSLCDPLGRLGKATHEETVKLMAGWIVEAPDVALPYVARGFSYLRLGQYARAMDDFDRAGQCDPRLAALARAARGYALAIQGEHRKSGVEFAAALKLDRKLAITHVFRGHAYIAQEKYTRAEAEFRLALRNGKDVPEAHEAMALLLAASPHESVRDGKKAVEHATAACELVKWANWAYLSTLAAAYAQNGQFDRAVEWAGKAIDLAPAESGDTLQKRLGLYQAGKPYRLK